MKGLNLLFALFSPIYETFFPSRNESIIQPNNSTITSQCKVDENAKLAIIIHGWMESCETIWVTTLMQSE